MFLEVKFHDNDFSWALIQSLERLWGWVVDNNKNKGGLTIEEVFLKLHKKEALEPMLKRIFILEQMLSGIEFETRGLYHKKETSPFLFDGKNIDSAKMCETLKHYYDYIDISIEFHEDKEFVKDGQNYEHGCLDLKTGEVDTF